jgi:hypothetical protein
MRARHSNSGGTANLRPFQPGRSGNPGGRPKGLAAKVRELYPVEELVESFVAVARGETVAGTKPKLRDVLEARKWLADRGWGKAPEHAPAEGGELEAVRASRVADQKVPYIDFSRLDDDDHAELRRILVKGRPDPKELPRGGSRRTSYSPASRPVDQVATNENWNRPRIAHPWGEERGLGRTACAMSAF